MSAPVDGRRAKGEARRAALVDAALVVLGRDGLGALTHRAIAAEAGVPLASASYHFAGIDDLILTALLKCTDDLVADLEALEEEPTLAGLAALLAHDVAHRRTTYIGYYELYLVAARKPEFRTAAMAWLDLLTDRFAPGVDAGQRMALQATIEGLCLHALLRDPAPSAQELEAALRVAWSTII